MCHCPTATFIHNNCCSKGTCTITTKKFSKKKLE